jgi:hypothetical protein
VAVPTQPVADQEHPYSEEHAVDVALALHGETVPVQVELQEQPYSAEQSVDVVFALHGVTVPPHVPGFQLQPYWYEQRDCDVIAPHAVSVPVQAVVHEQPALLQREDEPYEAQVDGVPEHVYVVPSQLHPMFRHSTWYDDDPLQ